MAIINCPECGKEISDKATQCPSCGFPIGAKKEVKLHCPYCFSTRISEQKKGFSGGKAVAGAVLTGGIGLLAGTIGMNKMQLRCNECNKSFKGNEVIQMSDEEVNSNIVIIREKAETNNSYAMDGITARIMRGKSGLYEHIARIYRIPIKKSKAEQVLYVVFLISLIGLGLWALIKCT